MLRTYRLALLCVCAACQPPLAARAGQQEPSGLAPSITSSLTQAFQTGWECQAVDSAQQTDIKKQLELALGGDAKAQAVLGGIYASGRGVRQNDRIAVSWLRKSADQGYVDAQLMLGYMLLSGRGTSRDPAEAAGWFRAAAAQGNALARNNLGFLYAAGDGVARDGGCKVSSVIGFFAT